MPKRSDSILGLLYHRLVSPDEYACIEPKDERTFAVTEPRFREQLTFLRDSGYHPVAADDVLDHIESGKSLPARPVLITFDDGSESVHSRALPTLQEFGFPALLFVTTDPEAWIFRRGNTAQRRLTEEEIRRLDESGITIGSHAVSHRPLASMSIEEIEIELGESKGYLERVLGKPVEYFGVPLNWYGKPIRDAAIRLGYRAVFTSDNGVIHRRSDPFHLKRFAVDGRFTSHEFARSLKPRTIALRRLAQLFRRLPARALGPRLWMPLREKIFASRLGEIASQRAINRIAVLGFALLLVIVWLLIYCLGA